MKKALILLMSVLCFSIFFSGCGFENMQMPQKVVVKTDATYNFNIANFDSEKNSNLDLSKYFDIQKLLSQTDESGSGSSSEMNFNVYKYNDGTSDYQQLLLHMPIQEIEFDFGDSFKDMDFSKAVEGFDVKQDFEVPDVGSLDKSEDLNLGNIGEQINNGVTFLGYTSPTPIEPVFGGGALFESVSYKTGKLIIDTTEALLGNTYYPNGKMTLKDAQGNILSSGTFSNGVAELDITGETLTASGMTLVFSDYYSMDDLGVMFRIRIGGNSELKRAVGVTLNSNAYSIPPVDVNFPLSLDESLGQVTIKEGELTVEILEPDSWEGNIIRDYSINVTGGLECNISKASPSANLNDTQIKNQDIKAKASVTLVLDNATIDFEDVPQVRVQTSISKIDATVTMPDDFKTEITENLDIPDELKNYVKQIQWKKTGFNITYTNKLPENNDLKLKIKSNFLGITSDEYKVLTSGGENATAQTISITNDEGWDGMTVFEGTGAISKMDVTGDVQLPGTTPGKLTVSNVSPGKTYSIEINIQPVFEWEKAWVKLPDDVKYEDKMNTGINKKALFESLGEDIANKLDKIQISSLPLYIFATVPDFFNDMSSGFSGRIDSYYATQKEGEDPVMEAGTKKELLKLDDNFSFTSMPVLQWDENDKSVVVNTNFGTPTMNFSDALNNSGSSKDSTLFLDYSVGLGSDDSSVVEVTSQQLESLKKQGKSSIKMDVVLILNLNFTLNDDLKIDLTELLNQSDDGNNSSTPKTDQQKDLFGREQDPSSGSDENDLSEYLSAIKNARLTIDGVKFPLKGNLKLKVDWGIQGDTPQEIVFGDGQRTQIVIANPSALLETYPLEPKLELVVEKGTFGLKRDLNLGGKLSLGVDVKGDLGPFDISGQNNSNNGGNK